MRAIHVRLVVAQPEQFRRREARERAVARQRGQPREPERRLDLAALGAGALVVPDDRRPQHAVIGVERDQAVHLTGEPDALRRTGGGAQPREHGLRRPPPILRILLSPAGARRRQRIPGIRGRDDATVGIEGEPLDAAGADVQPEYAHGRCAERPLSLMRPGPRRRARRRPRRPCATAPRAAPHRRSALRSSR